MAYIDDKNKKKRLLYSQAKAIKENALRVLNDTASPDEGRYISFWDLANLYNNLAHASEEILELPKNSFPEIEISQTGNIYGTMWRMQKRIIENVLLKTEMIITYLEDATDYVEDEFEKLSIIIKNSLRSMSFSAPEKEIEVQDNLERLLIGRGLAKGIEYDRESGKFEFSGKEYIPDFILPKLNLCIEVKLLKEGKKSRIIDEINADITAYSTKYERLMFVVYDLGVIRDENEFRRDIENSGVDIKVLVIKN